MARRPRPQTVAAAPVAAAAEAWERWPEPVRPKMRLFFSIDIVGSTALKQETRAISAGRMVDNSHWFDAIQRFYTTVVDAFRTECAKTPDRLPVGLLPPRPVVWKTAGDEVLFWLELTDSRLISHCINAWKATAETVRDGLRRINGRLDVKCTMWSAHFPWRNKMIYLSTSGSAGLKGGDNLRTLVEHADRDPDGPSSFIPDFIGPGIDIGFRLASYATSRRFVISAEIAYILAVASIGERHFHDLNIFYDGKHAFKGILGGTDYPVFWIDMTAKGHTDAYERDLAGRTVCTDVGISKFLDAFYDETTNYLYRPFIATPSERYLTMRPAWYDAVHREMLESASLAPLR